jgi:hypothetical protein
MHLYFLSVLDIDLFGELVFVGKTVKLFMNKYIVLAAMIVNLEPFLSKIKKVSQILVNDAYLSKVK